MKRLSHEEKQKRLKGKKIFVSGSKEINSLSDVLKYMLSNETRGKTILTDRFNSKRHQRTGSARSIEDMYILASTYLPNITYKQVFEAVEALYKAYPLTHWWCYTVNRRVHGALGTMNLNSLEEYLNKNNLNYYEK